jgi:hypothetical protein
LIAVSCVAENNTRIDASTAIAVSDSRGEVPAMATSTPMIATCISSIHPRRRLSQGRR